LVPRLIEVASEPELLTDDDDDEAVDEDDDIVYANVKAHDGFVNTKKAAIGALGALAEHTKGGFFPYVEQFMNTLIAEGSGSVYSFHRILRGEAISTFPSLLVSVCDHLNIPTSPSKGTVVQLPEMAIQFCKAAMAALMKTLVEDEEKIPVAQVSAIQY
jgi:hypothetical protein